MVKQIGIGIIIAALLLLAASFTGSLIGGAMAQGMKCYETKQLIAQLKKKHGETMVNSGASSVNNLFAWFASDKGTWTIVMFRNNGKIGCLMAAGRDNTHHGLPKKAGWTI